MFSIFVCKIEYTFSVMEFLVFLNETMTKWVEKHHAGIVVRFNHKWKMFLYVFGSHGGRRRQKYKNRMHFDLLAGIAYGTILTINGWMTTT